ncbi:DUF2000 family protein [Pseudonocardia xinjiangensis]|uniref:DUF2000 domain-containing protein n=1 Tax=Pseudonocardia xinjiangensis TaxID=75289 RepID=A0ABX1RKI9_9PSEU|nr:DUF2000 family protein [Pseudonocardia xinjiangensis]NMH80361.1 DUF2000 domain-containing protein [Pseudonocardia xinjiangensis]
MTPRCVLVLDPAAPRWLIANASAVLGASVGARGDVELGPGLVDATGSRWPAIAEIVVPVLAAPAAELVELRAAAHAAGVTALAFPDLARAAATYAELAAAMAATPAAEVHIHGLALLGPDRLVRGLTRGLRALGDPVTEAVR